MKTTMLTLSAAFALAFTLQAQTQTNAQIAAGGSDRFKHFDKNGDGKLSLEEFPYPYFYKQHDKDGDGLLSLEEAAQIKVIGKAAPGLPETTTTPTTPLTVSDFTPRPHGDEATKAGLKTDVLAKLDIAMQKAVANKEVSGVIGLIHHNGERGYFEAFGWQDIEAQKLLPKDALFRLQSMSKPVVSACAMALYDAELFTLDEPISKHCPEWAEPRVLENGELVPAKLAIPAFKRLADESAGIASKGGMAGLGQGGGGGTSSLFKQRDRNNDGKLGPEEIPTALFDRLDADKDGFVDVEELKALRKPN